MGIYLNPGNALEEMKRNSSVKVVSYIQEQAIDSKEFGNYWSGTETYESLMMYIAMDFDELRQLIVDMLGGLSIHVDVESFQNDMTSFNSADDVITLLIHMGYLAYDNKTKEVFIPNEEVRSVFLRAIKMMGGMR